MAMLSTQSSRHAGSVTVIWDMETCPVPDTREAANNISRTLRARQFNGPLQMSAYGDFTKFTQRTNQGLRRTNVHCIDVPKWCNSTHMMLTELAFFALDKPPPACIMVISGNDKLSDALRRLGVRRYTVILAVPSWVGDSSSLRDAGTFVWDWPSLSEPSRSLTYPRMANTHMSAQSSNIRDRPVAILWDIESCPLPSNMPTEEAAHNIKMALRDNQINGDIKMISAYGDFTKCAQHIIEGLGRANVQRRDVPKGTNPVNSILADMFFFALDNRPRAYIMLISGDDSFCHSLNRLGMYSYTVILSIPSVVGDSSYLRDAGQFVWDWPILSKTSRSLGSPKGLNDSPNEQKDSTGVQCVMSAPMIENRQKRLKRDVQGLLNRHSGEIEFDSFEDLYKDQFKEKLDYAYYGLADLEDLCEFLKGILVVGAVTPSGAKMIKAVNFYNLRKRKS